MLGALCVLPAKPGDRRQAATVPVDEVSELLPHLRRGFTLPDAVRGDGPVGLPDCGGNLLEWDSQGVGDFGEGGAGFGVQNSLTHAGAVITLPMSNILRRIYGRKSFGVSAGENEPMAVSKKLRFKGADDGE